MQHLGFVTSVTVAPGAGHEEAERCRQQTPRACRLQGSLCEFAARFGLSVANVHERRIMRWREQSAK
jgi:hypothetical protein